MWKEILAGAAGLAAACLLRSEYEKKALSTEETEIAADPIKREMTLLFLSDLHGNRFGKQNQRLLEAVEQQKPDAILCGGDMMITGDRLEGLDTAEALLTELAGRYPVYYGMGNHESRLRRKKELYGDAFAQYKSRLEKAGVIWLEDASADLGETVRISSVDLEPRFYRKKLFGRGLGMEEGYLESKLGRQQEQTCFQILLCHSPLYFSQAAAWGADLVLSGHFHGGTIRLPFLGGVMTPQFQFFHPFCAGTFVQNGAVLCVSRGLGTHSINIRFGNRPQLVVLKLKPTRTAAE